MPTEVVSPKVCLEATLTPLGSVVTTTGAWFHAIGSARTCDTPRLKRGRSWRATVPRILTSEGTQGWDCQNHQAGPEALRKPG